MKPLSEMSIDELAKYVGSQWHTPLENKLMEENRRLKEAITIIVSVARSASRDPLDDLDGIFMLGNQTLENIEKDKYV